MSKEKVDLTKIITEADGNAEEKMAILVNEEEFSILFNPTTVEDCLNALGAINKAVENVYAESMEIFFDVIEDGRINIPVEDLATLVLAKNHFYEMSELYRNKIGANLSREELDMSIDEEDIDEVEEEKVEEPKLYS